MLNTPNGSEDTRLSECLKEDSSTLKGCNVDGLTVFQSVSISSIRSKFICLAPGMSFELRDMEYCCDIGKLRNALTNKFGSNCAISIKRVRSSEHTILEDEDPFPYREEQIYISFEREIDIKEINGSRISNLRWDKQQQDIERCKYFVGTGALSGLLGVISMSLLLRNQLSESSMHWVNHLSTGALGTAIGALFGYGASCVCGYLGSSNTKQDGMNTL